MESAHPSRLFTGDWSHRAELELSLLLALGGFAEGIAKAGRLIGGLQFTKHLHDQLVPVGGSTARLAFAAFGLTIAAFGLTITTGAAFAVLTITTGAAHGGRGREHIFSAAG